MSVPTTTTTRRARSTARPGGSGLTRLVVRRLLAVPVVLLVLATLVFLAMRLIPGSAATALGGAGDGLSSEQIAQNQQRIAESLGLDRPLLAQYLTYLGDLARLDLGSSFFGGNDVLGLLGAALPATLELTVAAMGIAVLIGGVTGLLAAVYRGTWIDTLIRAVGTVSFSLPWFALGVLSVVVFGVWLGWLPVLGRLPNSLGYEPTTNIVLLDAILQNRPDLVLPWIAHLILPATTLALSMAGFITRIVRASVLEVRGEDFVRTARMKGMTENAILLRHVLRNSALPIVTVLGLQFGSLLGGAVITETVFAYPGVGGMVISGVLQRDYPVVQGAALAIALLYTLVNLAVDLFYLVLDPRLRKG
ncbi:ABC transporter permease [Pseudonocardia sp. ICBG1293]|uniref:ABC transporter permease n=1 Tax=Pseudonocardia sp. ICBG1293 TaxID=2844382 RepID=UPI001CCD8E6B|nr:ABC transporter permease [Pseudonocardia sp. ICBG1293]